MSRHESLEPLFQEFPPTSTDDWESKIHDDLRGKDYDDLLVWDALEGLVVQPYYRKEDLRDLAHVDLDADVPPLAGGDELPANRWAIRQDVANGDLKEARRLARQALERGATDLGIVTEVHDERVAGVPLQNVDDVARLIADVDPTETPVHLSGGPSAAVLLAFLLVRLQERELDPHALRGSVHFDPVAILASAAMTGSGRAFDLGADLARRSADFPHLRTWTVSAKPYHDAGASIVQEVAFVLGALSESLAQYTDRGVSVSDAASGMQFVVPVSTTYFLEMAKLRALRLLVPQVVNAFASEAGAEFRHDPEEVFIQAVTSQRTHTAYDPYVNMLRGTTESMAAVIGGCDVLTVAPYDAAFRSPGDFSTRIARNTQLILQHEAHADQVADPAAGSYYVEAVTDQIAEQAWSRFQRLESKGGILAALKDGRLQREVAEVRGKREREVQTRDRVLVGTNHYPDLGETKLGDLEPGHLSSAGLPSDESASDEPPSGGAGGANRSTEADGSSGDLLQTPTSPLRWSAQEVSLDEVTVSALVENARDGATLGDLVRALRAGGGTAGIDPLPRIRLSHPFDELRLRTEQAADAQGSVPTVFLAPLGHPAMRSARSNFARNFFGVAGFDVVENLRFETAADAAKAADDKGADLVVLCSSDAEYPDLVPALRDALANHGVDALLVVAGNSDKIEGDLPADGFVHLGSPLLDTLRHYQDRLIGED